MVSLSLFISDFYQILGSSLFLGDSLMGLQLLIVFSEDRNNFGVMALCWAWKVEN